MIIYLKPDTSAEKAEELARLNKAFLVHTPQQLLLVNASSQKHVATQTEDYMESFLVFGDDMQLSSRQHINHTREIHLDEIQIGGKSAHTLMIAGPCSVESESQLFSIGEFLHQQGIRILRAGCFKPRTSPYTFQGLGENGLKILAKAREKWGFKIITEIKDASHAPLVIEYADIIQVGAKAMYDQGILHQCGKTEKPVLLKRGFGSTLQEFVQSAEFILSGGNPNVILCERGIRTFETKTRFTLDLCGVAYLKEYSNLPVVVDPSHAMGYAYGVPDLAKAAMAMGVDGLLIEVHPNPPEAKSDASQQLTPGVFATLLDDLRMIAPAVKRTLV